MGWESVVGKHLKEMRASWEGVKTEALNILGWRRIVRSCAGLRQLVDEVSC